MDSGYRRLAADMIHSAIHVARKALPPRELERLQAKARAHRRHGRRVDSRIRDKLAQHREAISAMRWLEGAPAKVPAPLCCELVGLDHDAVVSKLRRMGLLRRV